MNVETVTAVLIAILSSTGLATIFTWLRDRKKLKSDAAASIVTAASGAVTTLERAIERLENELAETRRELEQSIRQNKELMAEVAALRHELEKVKRGDG